ncbi:MAG: GtrA family protein [Chloroflexia bacterium]|nr:GtrA family protein [Chloroflexia bacterium]
MKLLLDAMPQAIRFGVVGLVSNILLYLLYLMLTATGVGHKSAMSLLFAVGTVQTFIFNKNWTFAHCGFLQASFFRYVAAYSLAYLLNLTALLILVDNLGYPHQAVQGVMILILALMLFLLQKYWVFRVPTPAKHVESRAA